ncbi:MAG: threonine dehydratase [Alphaproteobacteria bacterium]|nr:threonine dehydratase [Alphaproteobacteria bacterium]
MGTAGDLATLEAAAEVVHQALQPTPTIAWPLLALRAGCPVWVKHENVTPIGAFKVRGGLVYLSRLQAEQPRLQGVCTATRGNHGQSIAFAARRLGLQATIVVPHGNSVEKNRAMVAHGARLVAAGRDFDEAVDHARGLAADEGLMMLPSFHPWLVEGVASYALEFLRAQPDLHTVYVPIGLGSGICGMIRARDALGLGTRIVGVVAERAPCYALSVAQRRVVPTNAADTLADGLAVRNPSPEALAIMLAGAERIVMVSEAEILSAIGHYYSDTHQLAEGAGAAPLAALLKEGPPAPGAAVGLVLSGGNIDRTLYLRALGAAA